MSSGTSSFQDSIGLFVKSIKAGAEGVREVGEHRNTVMCHQSQVPKPSIPTHVYFSGNFKSSKRKLLIPMEIFSKEEMGLGPKKEHGTITEV